MVELNTCPYCGSVPYIDWTGEYDLYSHGWQACVISCSGDKCNFDISVTVRTDTYDAKQIEEKLKLAWNSLSASINQMI